MGNLHDIVFYIMHNLIENTKLALSLSPELSKEFSESLICNDMSALKDFSERLNVSTEDLIYKSLSSEYLELRMKYHVFLDPKYSIEEHGNAKAKTLHTLINHLDSIGLEKSSNIFIKKFGLTRNYLSSDLNRPINPNLIMDFFNSLRPLGVGYKRIELIGAEGKNYLPKTLKNKIKDLKNVKDLLTFLYEEVFSTQYDDLFYYNLHSLKNDEAIALTIPNLEAHEAYGKLVGDQSMCAYKRGIVEGALSIAGLKANVFESDCIYNGDKACKTHIKLLSSHPYH